MDNELSMCIDSAIQAMGRAYAPYSNFRVGAALIDQQGHLSIGCNVENASYGLSICAERNAIAAAVTGGMKKIKILVIVSSAEDFTSPCGACRQVIAEFSDEHTRIVLADRNKAIMETNILSLLPGAFSL